MKNLTFSVAFLFIQVVNAQILVPAPMQSPYFDESLHLMPDSSFIVMHTGEKMEASRYVYNGKEWQAAPNQVTKLLNSLITEETHIHFRFSPLFDRVSVIQHRDGIQRFYISKLEGGQWQYFQEILDPTEFKKRNHPPSFSEDGKRLYINRRTKKNQVVEIYDTDDPSKPLKEIKFDQLTWIEEALGVGNDGLILYAIVEKSKSGQYFFVKEMESGAWTAPIPIDELGTEYLFGLNLSGYPEYMTYTNFSSEALYLQPTPSILYKEISRGSSKNTKAQVAISKKSNLEQPLNTTNAARSKKIKPRGEYFALLIGNADYKEDALDLERPVQDIEALRSVLLKNYKFPSQNIISVINADRGEIFETLYDLRTRLTREDNLLIFYAGHGYWDEQVSQGYWWPVDANPKNPANWLSNSDLREQIRGMNTAHTLLISDACFSGGIFKTRGGGADMTAAPLEIQLLYRLPSRRAMTSGALSSVPDNSVFFKYLIKYLEENKAQFLPSSELFTQVRRAVLNNSLTVPQDGVIMDTGDEGGDFIFIRKE